MPSKPEDQPQRPTPAVGQVWRDSGNEYAIVFLVNQEQYAFGLLMEVLRADTYVGKWTGKSSQCGASETNRERPH